MRNEKIQNTIEIRTIRELIDFLNNGDDDLIVSITVVTEKEAEENEELRTDLH